VIYRATLNLFNRSIIYLHYHLWIINAPSRDLSAENKSKRNQTCLEYHTLLIAAAWANIVLQKATLSNVWMLNSCETKTIWSHITAPITEKIQIFFIGLQYTNNAEQALYFDGAQLPWCKKSTEIVIYTTMFQWIQNGPHFLFLIRSLQSLADSFSSSNITLIVFFYATDLTWCWCHQFSWRPGNCWSVCSVWCFSSAHFSCHLLHVKHLNVYYNSLISLSPGWSCLFWKDSAYNITSLL